MTEGSAINDAELMSQTAAGDDSAFEVLVERYQGIVYGTCYRMLGSYHAEAQDVAQMVFVRVYKAAGSYRPAAQYKTWLMTITRNCVFTHLKKMKRMHEKRVYPVVDEETDQEVDYLDDSITTATENLQEKELMQVLQRAIEQLPEQQRMALILRQYEQMDYEQIARTLKTSVASVKSLIFRARDTLRSAVKAHKKN
ncbi:MAG: sigma-70 family RNA polymerase sigma factor [Verrucomicrobiota bacterium]